MENFGMALPIRRAFAVDHAEQTELALGHVRMENGMSPAAIPESRDPSRIQNVDQTRPRSAETGIDAARWPPFSSKHI